MKKFYTISEIAEFFNISRQTLIYYDKIDIFKPAFIDENGYRYYSRDQFSELSFIISLKNSGFSLNNIKEYFKSRNPEESLSFLEEKILDIERKFQNFLNQKKQWRKKF
ncbi:MAG: MerR family transcriptional regulator [Fusobacterium sp.]